MTKPDLSDPAIIERLAAALEAAGVDGIEITRPDQSLLIRVAKSANGPVRQFSSGKPDAAARPAVVKSPMAGEFWPSDPSRSGASASSTAGDTVGFLRVGPILLPIAAGPSKRLRRHLVEPGTVVGFGDPIAEFEPEA
ncbi:biotin carboxyl carrier protein [Neorhizobium huautlense]|uniref:Biotin carboxyl carrier protein n=1 Tax=Neorhizobium huautlense TaxID=67774 RepID=A0ABT9PQ23_9HYPH|nr:acetyl-CoA carboxylase [Neorhizobium huautlense]MDP9836286.1 biotin carboxyl carrier protein [Neorhizobium huautlense]